MMKSVPGARPPFAVVVGHIAAGEADETVICRKRSINEVGKSMTTNTCGCVLRQAGQEMMRPCGDKAPGEPRGQGGNPRPHGRPTSVC